jgi:hypothetical protein
VKYLITSIGLAAAFLLGPAASAQRPGPAPPNTPQQYMSDVQQLGYEHGYRDGADRGRQDRDRGLGRISSQDAYLDSARYSYNPSYGSRREYMSSYRDGFQAGYDDGYAYYERPGRYGEIYRPPGPSGFRNTGSRFDSGYREGVTAGQQDMQRNTRSDYRRSSSYRSGDPQFQDGFERGYQDGYGRSRYQYDGGGYFPNSGNNGVVDTRDGVGRNSRTISVPSTQQWTPTGIRVNQGDRLTFQSSGEIQISAGANNRASVAGSLSGRFVQNAPIPNALAGALIGRIDSGEPFGIGNQTSIIAPASGMLYLGINDDTLNDNSGQFTVALSW